MTGRMTLQGAFCERALNAAKIELWKAHAYLQECRGLGVYGNYAVIVAADRYLLALDTLWHWQVEVEVEKWPERYAA